MSALSSRHLISLTLVVLPSLPRLATHSILRYENQYVGPFEGVSIETNGQTILYMTNKLDSIPLFAWCERDRVDIQTNSAYFNAKPSNVFDDLTLPNCLGVKGRQRFLFLSMPTPWLDVDFTV